MRFRTLSAAIGRAWAAVRAVPGPPRPALEGGMHFVAVAEIDRFDAFTALVGNELGRGVVAQLRERIGAEVRPIRLEQAGRARLEFVFTARSIAVAHARLLAASRAFGQVEQLVRLGYALNLAIGVAQADAPILDDLAVDRAQSALDGAQRKHQRIAFASADGGGNVSNLRLLRELKEAVQGGEIEAFYMPKLHTRTGKVTSAEALVRWRHPSRGLMLPDQFIPIAEQSGQIRALTEAVIERALADQERLTARGFNVSIDVNLSGVLLCDLDFVAWATSRLPDCAGKIGFEITETAMIADPEGALVNLQRFADAGVRLAIDDYGSGFSSLAYLQKLPVHELKIDKTFISGLATTHRDPLLVRSTIELAHALDMEVVAEGVDTPEALALLQVMGCDAVQGFLISPPLPFDGFATFLAAGSFRNSSPELASLARMRRLTAAKKPG